MIKQIVVTRPNHDITTNYLYYWTISVIDQAVKASCKLADLAGKRANQKEFTSVVGKLKPDFIFLNGHGSDDSVCGQDNEILIKSGENEKILDETITFSRSCSSAKILGKFVAKNGNGIFIGYDADFFFFTNGKYLSKPLEDNDAKLFLEPSNIVAASIIKGNSPELANEKSKKLFKKNINFCQSTGAPKENREMVPFLLWDMDHQVALN
ncbi:MAG: hypothetical protein AAB838_00045 [Patescibacteria group bacterium]